MTKSLILPAPELIGLREPRLRWVPPSVSTASATEAVETARAAGVLLDPWQQDVLRDGLGELADGTWAALEVCLIAPRRNGKNEAGAVARELAGLFVFEEPMIVHTAHRLSTARKAHSRMKKIIASRPKLAKRVAKAPESALGGYGFILDNGPELWFETRTEQIGRGGDADLLIVDEALYATEEHMGAVLPLILARQNPQIWYLSSAPDQLLHPAKVLARVRARGLAHDPRLALIEHSAEGSIEQHDPKDRRLWAQASPSLNLGRPWSIRESTVAVAQRSMPRRKFAVEVLAIGDWPQVELEEDNAMVLGGKASAAQWLAARTELGTSAGALAGATALAIAPSRGGMAIGGAFVRADGARQVEFIEQREGRLWVLGFLRELIAKRDPVAVVINPAGAARGLITELEKELRIEVTKPSGRQAAQACSALVAGVKEAGPLDGGGFVPRCVVHPGETLLDEAAMAARVREIATGGLYDWENGLDVAPLWAVTLALYGLGEATVTTAPAPRLISAKTVVRGSDLATAGF